MARLYTDGAELNTNADGFEITSTDTGTACTIQSTVKRSGNYAWQAYANVAFESYFQFVASPSDNQHFARTYIRIEAAPTATTRIARFLETGISQRVCARLKSDMTLILTEADGTQIGSPSAALSLDTWYRLEMTYDNNDPVSTSALLLDGTTIASTTTGTTIDGVNAWSWGNIDGDTTLDIFFDDLAVNDTTGTAQASYPGEGSVVLALPTGAGDNAATTGVYSYINEIPPTNTATSGSTMIELDTTTSIGDYAMTDSSTLGIGSSDTITLVAPIARVREETSGTSNYTLRVKSASGGTTVASSSLDAGNATPRTNPSGTVAFANKFVSYTDPTTSAAWTPTGTNSIDNMQVGAATTDGTPDVWVLWLGAHVEYVPATPGGATYPGYYGQTGWF